MALILVNKTGAKAKRGDKLVDFRGNTCILTSWEPPQRSASTGRVYVKPVGGMFETGYSPSVFNMAFVESVR